MYAIPDSNWLPKMNVITDSYLLPEDPRYIAGKFDPSEHPDFTGFKSDTVQGTLYLRKEVYEAFLKMAEAAIEDSITLNIISATRSFDYQKDLWENKWTGITYVDGKKLHLYIKDPKERAVKIMEYSAPPGFSRHHWGTDFDLNSTEPEYFETVEGIKVYEWLKINAFRFGFCQTYTEFSEERPRGFHEEKWHWSYFPVSEKIWRTQIKNFKDLKIYRFKGSSALKAINLFDYIFFTNSCPDNSGSNK
jgi:LAS superfamily LD-carboxypeptidase LdcB